MAETILSVDGGATQTRAAVFDTNGTVLAHGKAGPANASRVGIEAAVAQVVRAVKACKTKATVLVAGIAGAATLADFKKSLQSALAEFGEKVLIDSDSTLALFGALEDRPGVVFIAGTGSVVIARDAQGHITRRGGRADREGDPGSALAIGHRAITTLRQTPNTWSFLSEPLGNEGYQDIVRMSRERDLKPHQIAGLAQIVDLAADLGDSVASSILREAARDLVKEAGPLLDSGPIVSYAGSVFSSVFFKMCVKSKVTRAGGTWKEPVAPPIAGGFFIGMKELGRKANLARVAESLPAL